MVRSWLEAEGQGGVLRILWFDPINELFILPVLQGTFYLKPCLLIDFQKFIHYNKDGITQYKF